MNTGNDDPIRHCPACGSKMSLHETGNVRYSCPLQYEREWRCTCGVKQEAPARRGTDIVGGKVS